MFVIYYRILANISRFDLWIALQMAHGQWNETWSPTHKYDCECPHAIVHDDAVENREKLGRKHYVCMCRCSYIMYMYNSLLSSLKELLLCSFSRVLSNQLFGKQNVFHDTLLYLHSRFCSLGSERAPETRNDAIEILPTVCGNKLVLHFFLFISNMKPGISSNGHIAIWI